MYKTKTERQGKAEFKKYKKDPYREELADPKTIDDIITMVSEKKEFSAAVSAIISEFNASRDNLEYVFESKSDQSCKFRVEITLREIEESKKTKPAKGVAAEKSKIEGIRMWSPYADKIIGCSAEEFNEREKSKPESMQSLFEQMNLNKPRMFVLKNKHNKEFDKYDMTVVFCE